MATVLYVVVGLLSGCGTDTNTAGQDGRPERVLVAVASNFVPALRQLQPLFEARGDYRLSMSVGSTGKLYAQVHAGAPYDVLLAADQRRPMLLEEDGLAAQRFAYAEGRLVLWHVREPSPDVTTLAPLEVLKAGKFARLVMANPKLAPYGAAAQTTLKRLRLYEPYADKLVFGENLGQAHAMLATGNAEIGFTALAFLSSTNLEPASQFWLVPSTMHEPIRQEAVVLQRAADKPAALAFVAFLRSPEAREVIAASGYLLPTG